jgi:hypothetical protein
MKSIYFTFCRKSVESRVEFSCGSEVGSDYLKSGNDAASDINVSVSGVLLIKNGGLRNAELFNMAPRFLNEV